MGEALSSSDADILLEGMEDNSGQINYEEFVRSILDGWSICKVLILEYNMDIWV